MPARVAARIELEGVRVFLDANTAAQKAFAVLGASAIAAAVTVTAAMAGLVTSVATVGTIAVKSAANFEQAMKKVQAVGGTSTTQTTKLSDNILRMSQSYEFSAVEIAQASEEIIKSGVAADDAGSGVLKASLNLALLTKGEMSTAKAATFVAGSMTAWGIEAKDVTRITDSLTAAANSSAISVNDVMRSLQQVTSVADFMGMRLEDVTTAIALLGQEYMRNSDAGTSMKQMLLKLIAPSAKAEALMHDYSINLKDSNKNALPFIDVVGQLNNAFGEQALAEGKVTKGEQEHALATIFQSDAIRSAAVLAMAGVPGYQKMANEIGKAGNSAEEMANIIQSALLPRLKMLGNIASSFGISFGGPIVKALGSAVNELNNALRAFDFKKFEVLGQFIVDIATNGSASGDALRKAFGSDIAELIIKFVSIFTKLRDVVIDEVIPAFFSLKSVMLGEKSTTQAIGEAFVLLGDMLRKTVSVFADFVLAVSLLAQELPKLPGKIDELTTSLGKLNTELQKNQTLVRALEFAALAAGAFLAVRAFAILATGVLVVGTRLGLFISKISLVPGFIAPVIAAATKFGAAWSPIMLYISSAIMKVALSVQFLGQTLAVSLGSAAKIIASTWARVPASISMVTRAFQSLISIGTGTGLALRIALEKAVSFIPWILSGLSKLPAAFMVVRTAAVGLFAAIVGGSGGTVLIIAAIVAALAALYIFWPQISAAVVAFANTVSNVFTSQVLPVLTGVWNTIKAAAEGFFNFIRPALEVVGTILLIGLVIPLGIIAVALYSLYAIARIAFTEISTQINNTLVTWESLKNTIATVANAISTWVTGAFETVKTMASIAIAAVVQEFNNLGAIIGYVFRLIVWSIKDALGPDLISSIKTVVVSIITALGSIGPFLADIASKISLSLHGMFSKTLKAIFDLAIGAADALVLLDPSMKPARDALKQLALEAESGFSITRQEIINTADTLRTQVAKEVNDSITKVEKLAKEFIDSATTSMEAWLKSLGAIGSGIASTVADGIANVRNLGQAFRDEAASAAEAMRVLNSFTPNVTTAAPWGLNNELAPEPRTITITPPSGKGPGATPGGGGGGGGGEDADKWTKFFTEALKALPLMNQELAKFLGGLAKEAPERAQPIVTALMSSVSAIKEMAVQKSKLIAIDIGILKINQNIARGQLALNQVNLQMKAIELSYAGQILVLQNALLNVQMRITQLQNEINELQRDNVVLARQRVELEMAMLPAKQRIAQIDREIEKLGRADANIALEKAKMYQAVLPALQKQQQIENAISQVHNKQLGLLQEEQNIRLKINDIALTGQLRKINKGLDAAWGAMDVTKILDLEKQREAAETQQATVQEQLTTLQEQIDLQGLQESLKINGLNQEKLAVDAIVLAYNNKLLVINQTQELEKANRDVLIAQLEVEKQALIDLLQPMDDQYFKLGQQIEAEKMRNALRIFDLQQEVIALQLVAQQIQFQIDKLNLQMANELLQYQLRAIQLEQYLNEEESKKNALETERLKQEDVFAEMVAGFLASMKQSGAFSTAEAIEVATRLGLWNDSISKLIELEGQWDTITQAASESTDEVDAYRRSIDQIKTYIEVNIHTVYTSSGTPGRALGGPVSSGQAYTVGERGKELFVPKTDGFIIPATITKDILSSASSMLSMPGMDTSFNQMVQVLIISNTLLEGIWTELRTTRAENSGYRRINYGDRDIVREMSTYNVNANYANQQSPASIGMDLRAMEMMVNR